MKHTWILFILLFLAACGPTLHSNIPQGYQLSRRIAVLPIKATEPMARERLEYIERALVSELSSAGFLVLDPRVTRQTCIDPQCARSNVLISEYGVGAFVSLDVQSSRRANLFAGYYNSISGTLRFEGSMREELVRVEHEQRESGGLLLQSGQFVQALIDTSDEGSAASRERLLDKFVEQLVAKLPRPSSADPSAQFGAVEIKAVSVAPLRAGRFKVCLEGSADRSATLLVGRTRSALREEKSGHYCGVLFLRGVVGAGQRVALELRSSFGQSSQRMLDDEVFRACPLGDAMTQDGALAGKLSYVCSSGAASFSKRCHAVRPACRDSKVVVYKAGATRGPFSRVAAVREGGTYEIGQAAPSAVYAVVAEQDDEIVSAPVVLPRTVEAAK